MRKVRVEPGRNGHHVGFGSKRRLPALVLIRGHLVGSDGPGIPVESAIDIADLRLEALGTETRPVGHEEAVCRALDSCPVTSVVGSFKGRHQGLAIDLELRAVRGVLGYEARNVRGGPGAFGSIVKGEEHAEAANRVGGVVSIVESGAVGRILAGNVERKTINARGFGFVDIVGPVRDGIGRCVANL